MQRSFCKRTMDLMLVILCLPFIGPLLALVACLVWVQHGWPVLFIQERAGFGCKPFRLYKFRTMTDKRDSAGQLLADGQRLTAVGRILRNTSLDELPELFNVLKGDMSLVGPRPLLLRYLPYYSEREALRHRVKPGVTGWAQIHGRNYLSWDERLTFDVWYVENRSLWLDIKILLQTVVKVIAREGVSADADLVEGALDEERKDTQGAVSASGQPSAALQSRERRHK